MSITIRLAWPIKAWPNPNRDRRKHWTTERAEARNIRAAAHALGTQALTKTAPIPSPVVVTLKLGFPDARPRDLENWSSKALLDGLVDSGIIAGDSHRDIVRTVRELDPERSDKGHIRVTVTIASERPGGER